MRAILPLARHRVFPAFLGIFVTIAVAAPVIWPWVSPHFALEVQDANYHLLRLYVFDFLLQQGSLYPRWCSELFYGYGYPLLNYYAPGSYHLGELLHLLGLDIWGAFQGTGVIAAVTGASGGYLLGLHIWRSRLSGVIVAAAYLWAPYPFITNLYLRAAVPEALAWALLPWLLLGGWLALRRPGWLGPTLLAAVLAATILVHTVGAMVAAGLLLGWLATAWWTVPASQRRYAVARAGLAIVIGLLLPAFFWLPAVGERGLVHVERGLFGELRYSEWLYPPFRPITSTPRPQYRVSRTSPVDLHLAYPHAPNGLDGPVKVSFGQALLVAAAGALVLAQRPWRQRRWSSRDVMLLGATLGSAVLWWLTTTWSQVAWQTVPLLSYLQFPWRLMGPLALGLGLIAAGLFARLDRPQWPLAGLLLLLLGYNGIAGLPNRIQPEVDRVVDAAKLDRNEEDRFGYGTTSLGEFLPLTVQFDPPLNPGRGGAGSYERRYPEAGWIGGRVWPFAGQLHVQQVWAAPTRTTALVQVEAGTPAALAFRTIVFPGWRAYVDHQRVPLRTPPYDPIERGWLGFAIVDVPPGQHRVDLAFGWTPWRLGGTLLTVLGVGLAIALLVRSQRRRVIVVGGATTLVALVLLGSAVIQIRHPLPQLRSPPPRLVADVATAVRQGTADIASPDGSTLGRFVDVRYISLAGRPRRWLYMHPPSEVRLEVLVPPRAAFQAGLGMAPETWQAPDGDGVRFLLQATAGGRTETLLDRHLHPRLRASDRGWRFVRVDLGRYAGQRVTLTLRTEGVGTPVYDWAGWADPVVYQEWTARLPGAAARKFGPP